MTATVEHRLVNGYIHSWQAAGPRSLTIPNPRAYAGEDAISRVYHDLPDDLRAPSLELAAPPLPLESFESAGLAMKWRYYRCAEDHRVDFSAVYPLWTHAAAWAYTEIHLPTAAQVTFAFNTPGPVTAWLNGSPVIDSTAFTAANRAVEVELQAGQNQILVRFETAGVRACPHYLALRVEGLPEEIANEPLVKVPSGARYPRRQEVLVENFEKAYLDEVVNHRGAHFNLRWAGDSGVKFRYAYQVQDKDGFSYVEGSQETDYEKPYDAGHTFRLLERQYYLTIRPVLLEYFEHNLRYEKKLPIYVLDNEYASAPRGEFSERTREALEDAAKHEGELFGQIARMALGLWGEVRPNILLEQANRVQRREAGSQALLLGILSVLYRYSSHEQFPAELSQPLEDCVLGFRYGPEEEAGAADGLVFETESDSLLSHACLALAGQLFPDRVFSSSGRAGMEQRDLGEQRALDWLRRRGAYGFQEWNSNDTFEKLLLALASLTGLAKNQELCELSAVMIDKVLFSIAVNSYKGAFGSTHGRTKTSMIKSAQLEATSGVARMMWGMGVYNPHIFGTVALATSGYEFPLLLGEIASDQASAWVHERHQAGSPAGEDVCTVTYRTPDYMLSSAQDYRPGQPGVDEHIWQATFGPDALVFANHPACMNSEDASLPGFWLGNRSLPRVAQWKDVLVSIHRLPEDDWMGFTHAYFPVYQFSEYEIRPDEGGRAWAFARKDSGYLALTCSQPFELVKRAPDGFRELRANGLENSWLVHMGRAEMDGSFEQFKKHIMSMKVDFQGLDVRLKTLRGEYLSFGWQSPLVVNGHEKALRGYKHHESPYSMTDFPAEKMEIQSGGTAMRLDFS